MSSTPMPSAKKGNTYVDMNRNTVEGHGQELSHKIQYSNIYRWCHRDELDSCLGCRPWRGTDKMIGGAFFLPERPLREKFPA